jgi:hypothetical protein
MSTYAHGGPRKTMPAGFIRVYLCLSVVALGLLTGCAEPRWHKQGADAARLEEDLGQCRMDARLQASREAFPRTLNSPSMTDATGRAVFVEPRTHGTDPLVLEQDLTNSCMRGKGYAFAPAESR